MDDVLGCEHDIGLIFVQMLENEFHLGVSLVDLPGFADFVEGEVHFLGDFGEAEDFGFGLDQPEISFGQFELTLSPHIFAFVSAMPPGLLG